MVIGVIGETTDTASVEYVEKHREPARFSRGELIFYGPPSNGVNGEIFPRDLSESDIWPRSKHCTFLGDPIKCGTDNAARNNVCDSLVTELYSDGSTVVPNDSRSICYLGDSAKNTLCCASWHNTVTHTLTKADVAGPANRIMTKCTEKGISGKINWIWLQNACTSFCLSNRGGHC